MRNEDLLKEKRSRLLSELVENIKLSVQTNKVKGELSSKIYIYSRLADFTYYSEVSIRKFLTGTVPKDITSFVQGIIQYSKLVGLDDEYIENFTREYVQASNAIVIESDTKIKTRNNLIPQDLTSIIRPKKLVEFLDSYLIDNINISYIYGYKLTGKTKSVMAYMSDLVNKNIYENIIWSDIRVNENQIDEIINTILIFALSNNETINESAKKDVCLDFLRNTKTVIVLDFNNYSIDNRVIEFIKEIANFTKIIILSSNTFSNYEKQLSFYTKTFCTNHYIEKNEFEEMLKLNEENSHIIQNNVYIVNKLYEITGGFPFVAIYLLKKIIEENKFGLTLNDAINKYSSYNVEEYEELSLKIISEKWNELNTLAKKILIVCSKFNCSISLKLVAEICGVQVNSNEWKDAIKQCYEIDLLNPIILNNPRVTMNNVIRTLVLQYQRKENFNEGLFLQKIQKYYLDLAIYIGECYDDLNKLKLLDELDEWNVLVQVLEYLEKNKMYEQYISIVRELKYYIYVRGIWKLGEQSLHLKRALYARELSSVNEELEALCDYINICSKSKNNEEAEKYLEQATTIIENIDKEKLDKRVMCLYNHVKGLYLYNCKKDYKKCYKIWKDNKDKYSKYVSLYRNLVNDLWITRCYIKIESDFDKICTELKNKIDEMKKENFVRAELDYELLLIGVLLQKFQENSNNVEYLDKIEEELDKCDILFNTKSYKDIRNEAQYCKYRSIIYLYKNNKELSMKYYDMAITKFKLMNCFEDITNLQNIIDEKN